MAGSVNLSLSDVQKIKSAVNGYCDELQTKFIKECRDAIETCGLAGAHKRDVEEIADNMYEALMTVIETLSGHQSARCKFEDGMSVIECLEEQEKAIEEQLAAFGSDIKDAAKEASSKSLTTKQTARKTAK
jgi:hypothetical protein